MSYKINVVGLTDTGLVRRSNEDAWKQVPELDFIVLADGMGGHQAGEVAAQEAVNISCKLVKKIKKQATLFEIRDEIAHIIQQVNIAIHQLSRSDEHLRGMGTTLCCLQIKETGIVYGHVGDSRIYRMRNKKLEQLTSDHSLLRELLDLGQLSESQASDFLYKNILTKAIGTEAVVEPSVYTGDIADGDIFLLCSDGLSDPLSQKELETILKKAPSIEEAAKTYIQEAKFKGGYDNITVVLVQVQKS